MKFLLEIVVALLLVAILFGSAIFFRKNRSASPFQYTVEVIDGCEYLRFRTHYHDAITHKGGCKNH